MALRRLCMNSNIMQRAQQALYISIYNGLQEMLLTGLRYRVKYQYCQFGWCVAGVTTPHYTRINSGYASLQWARVCPLPA